MNPDVTKTNNPQESGSFDVNKKPAELNPQAAEELATIVKSNLAKTELQKIEAQIHDAEEQFERGAVSWGATTRLAHFKEIRDLKAQKRELEEKMNTNTRAAVKTDEPTTTPVSPESTNPLTEFLQSKIDGKPASPVITNIDSEAESATEKARTQAEQEVVTNVNKELRGFVQAAILEEAKSNKIIEFLEGTAKNTHEMWRKSWKKRLGIGACLIGAGIVIPGAIFATGSIRAIMGAVGSTLATEAIIKANQAAKEVRKGDPANPLTFINSYVQASKEFFKTLIAPSESKKGIKQRLDEANQAFVDKKKEVAYINTPEELEAQLDRELKLYKKDVNDNNKLNLLELKLMNLATTAKDLGLNDIREVAGAKKSIDLILDKYIQLLDAKKEEVDITKINTEGIREEKKKGYIEYQVILKTLEKRKEGVNGLKEIAKVSRTNQTWNAVGRWTFAFIAGAATSLLYPYLKNLWQQENIQEAAKASAVAGGVKELGKEKVAIAAQEIAQQGNVKETITRSVFGNDIKIIEHDGSQWAQIDGKEYAYDGNGSIMTRIADLDGHAKNVLVKINLQNGFGVAPNGHVVQALDLTKEGVNHNYDGILAREGNMLHDASGKMINGRIWIENDGSHHASILGKVDVGTKMNPEGIVFDEEPKLPDDLKAIPGASDIYDKKFEVEFMTAPEGDPTPHGLADAYLKLYDPTHADASHIAALEAKLHSIDLNQAYIKDIKQIYNPTNAHEAGSAIKAGAHAAQEQITQNPENTAGAVKEAAKTIFEPNMGYSQACKTFIESNFVGKEGIKLVSAHIKENMIDILKDNPDYKNLVADPKNLTIFSDQNRGWFWFVNTQANEYIFDENNLIAGGGVKGLGLDKWSELFPK